MWKWIIWNKFSVQALMCIWFSVQTCFGRFFSGETPGTPVFLLHLNLDQKILNLIRGPSWKAIIHTEWGYPLEIWPIYTPGKSSEVLKINMIIHCRQKWRAANMCVNLDIKGASTSSVKGSYGLLQKNKTKQNKKKSITVACNLERMFHDIYQHFFQMYREIYFKIVRNPLPPFKVSYTCPVEACNVSLPTPALPTTRRAVVNSKTLSI